MYRIYTWYIWLDQSFINKTSMFGPAQPKASPPSQGPISALQGYNSLSWWHHRTLVPTPQSPALPSIPVLCPLTACLGAVSDLVSLPGVDSNLSLPSSPVLHSLWYLTGLISEIIPSPLGPWRSLGWLDTFSTIVIPLRVQPPSPREQPAAS